jgi:hypothetical protein
MKRRREKRMKNIEDERNPNFLLGFVGVWHFLE